MRGRQRYRCRVCAHQWVEKRGKRVDIEGYYYDWLFGRRCLREIAHSLGCSVPTVQSRFATLDWPEGLLVLAPDEPVNLLIDCVFFGREYGYICLHDTRRIIYAHEIKTETVADLRKALRAITEAGYAITSVTIDGRRGFYQAIKKMLGPVPVQMCIFHQKSIIRRYLTQKPSLEAGKDLKNLTEQLLNMQGDQFAKAFYALKHQHATSLNARNEKGNFAHQKLRAAYRSIEQNMPMLFTHKDIPEDHIPTTTGRLEGFFAHLKEKILIHRGLALHNKKKAIRCFLNHQN